MNLRPPSRGESTFLFWTAVIMAVALTALAIWAIIEILTHKSVVYETPKPTVVYQPPIMAQPTVATAVPTQTTTVNLPASALSTSFSDIPVPTAQQQAITGGLINLEGAFQ